MPEMTMSGFLSVNSLRSARLIASVGVPATAKRR
jgi:hypothetical protein